MTKVKIRKLGKDVGLVLPKEMVSELEIKPGDLVNINVQKADNPLKELYGALKFKKPTRQLLDEFRKTESKYF